MRKNEASRDRPCLAPCDLRIRDGRSQTAPTWLKLAHETLDRAVLAAYAAVDPDGGWSEDWAAVWTETGAGQPLPDPPDLASPADRTAAAELAARRKETDQRVLANLLRMNLARAGK